jgi:predicted outer membrane repeat protein
MQGGSDCSYLLDSQCSESAVAQFHQSTARQCGGAISASHLLDSQYSDAANASLTVGALIVMGKLAV